MGVGHAVETYHLHDGNYVHGYYAHGLHDRDGYGHAVNVSLQGRFGGAEGETRSGAVVGREGTAAAEELGMVGYKCC